MEQIQQDKVPKREWKSLKKFLGCLPLNFNTLHYKSWCEIIHMTSATHVVDYSMGDAVIAVAALSMKTTYGGIALNALHQHFFLQRIDRCMVAFFAGPNSPHFAGDATRKMIGKAYDVNLESGWLDEDSDSVSSAGSEE